LFSNPFSNILPLSSFISHPNRRPKMAKKPMTKSQIISHFAGKFELSKRTTVAILDEAAALAVSETKKTGSFTLPGIGKLAAKNGSPQNGLKPLIPVFLWHPNGTRNVVQSSELSWMHITPSYTILPETNSDTFSIQGSLWRRFSRRNLPRLKGEG
jgi:hypothetical protein